MLLGEVVGAEQALRIGLGNRTVNDNELETAAKEFADRPAAQSPLAVSGARRAIDTVWHMSVEDALALPVEEQTRCLASEDFTEAGQALPAGRPPQWIGH